MTDLAIANQKGGVGKTTTTYNLAAALALAGKRTLVLDLDPQRTCSVTLGMDRGDMDRDERSGAMLTISSVLFQGVPLSDAIRPTPAIPSLSLVPGSERLMNVDAHFANRVGREFVLDEALSSVRDRYDVILYDCPGTVNVLMVMALVAADAYIVPLQPEYMADDALSSFFAAVNVVKQYYPTSADLLGILLTIVDRRRLAVHRETADSLRERYKDRVFRTEIPNDVRVKEAPSFGKSIFEYDPDCRAAAAYRSLTEEVVERSLAKGWTL